MLTCTVVYNMSRVIDTGLFGVWVEMREFKDCMSLCMVMVMTNRS